MSEAQSPALAASRVARGEPVGVACGEQAAEVVMFSARYAQQVVDSRIHWSIHWLTIQKSARSGRFFDHVLGLFLILGEVLVTHSPVPYLLEMADRAYLFQSSNSGSFNCSCVTRSRCSSEIL